MGRGAGMRTMGSCVLMLAMLLSATGAAAQKKAKGAAGSGATSQTGGKTEATARSKADAAAGEQAEESRVGELPGEAANDPILRAMAAELKRSRSQLRLQEMSRPFYIEYSVTDVDFFVGEAVLGAMRSNSREQGRLVRVVVRIGNYKSDSYFGQGEGLLDVLPIENDELALRHQIWIATDNAYKNALQAMTLKEAMLKNIQVEYQVDDFSKEPTTQAIEPTVKLDFDENKWLGALKETSALFKSDAKIQMSNTNLSFRAMNRYFMNTEGTVTRSGKTAYNFYYGGTTQAEDGMRLDRSNGFSVANLKDAPPMEELRKNAAALAATLKALREAPMVEDTYRGPVLFTPDAASDVFSQLFADNILGRKPDPGDPNRTVGDYATYWKSRVLPDFIDVVDDPTVERFDNKELLGSYKVDDEGVKAQPVTLVSKGELVNYLMGRRPIRDFARSNGHGRSAPASAPGPSISNLFIKPKQAVSPAELLKQLLEMAKKQDKKYGYMVETTGPELTPRLLYRVYVADGHRELVRGAVFGQLDARAMRNDLVAAGNDPESQDRSDPIPRSIIAPSLLFGELELRRNSAQREKLPQYPPPAVAGP